MAVEPLAPSTPKPPATVDSSSSELGGKPHPQIVNGSKATRGQFPYAGHLALFPCATRDTRKKPAGQCGAALVLPRVLVTAGHCIEKCGFSGANDNLPKEPLSRNNVAVIWPRIVAKLNITNITSATEVGSERRVILGAVKHADYYINQTSGDPERNDIMLLWFRNASKVAPVRLTSATSTYIPGKTNFRVAGWGYTDPFFPSLSTVLQYVT
jgi:hypothetical protein